MKSSIEHNLCKTVHRGLTAGGGVRNEMPTQIASDYCVHICCLPYQLNCISFAYRFYINVYTYKVNAKSK